MFGIKVQHFSPVDGCGWGVTSSFLRGPWGRMKLYRHWVNGREM